jgi:hypothetical protein
LSHEEKWPWIELSMGGVHRGSSERGERGGRGEERGRGHSCWEEEGGRGTRGLLLGELGGCCLVWSLLLCVRKKARRRREKRKEKKGRKKEKEKMGKFSKLGNFRKKIKDNL